MWTISGEIKIRIKTLDCLGSDRYTTETKNAWEGWCEGGLCLVDVVIPKRGSEKSAGSVEKNVVGSYLTVFSMHS